MITYTRLKELLVYNPCEGVFRWRITKPGTPIRAGKLAGSLSSQGYYRIGLDGKSYRVARLAWFYAYKEWPNIIDHLDRKTTNDSLWNLSNGTQKENMRNSSIFVGDINSRSRSAYARAWRRQIYRLIRP